MCYSGTKGTPLFQKDVGRPFMLGQSEGPCIIKRILACREQGHFSVIVGTPTRNLTVYNIKQKNPSGFIGLRPGSHRRPLFTHDVLRVDKTKNKKVQ